MAIADSFLAFGGLQENTKLAVAHAMRASWLTSNRSKRSGTCCYRNVATPQSLVIKRKVGVDKALHMQPCLSGKKRVGVIAANVPASSSCMSRL